MDLPPVTDDPAIAASQAHACKLPEATAELLASLDTTLLPALTATRMRLHVPSTSAADTARPGSLTLEISEASYQDIPCYLVMSTLSLPPRPGAGKCTMQVVAHVSTHLQTLRETRILSVAPPPQTGPGVSSIRCTRNVWGVAIKPPGSTRASSIAGTPAPGSRVGSALARSAPGSARAASGSSRAVATPHSDMDPSAIQEEALLFTADGENPTPEMEEALANHFADAVAISDQVDAIDDPPAVSPARPSTSSEATGGILAAASPSSRPASSSNSAATATDHTRLSTPTLAAAHYIVQESGTAGAADKIVTIDCHSSPGMLFAGAELVFLLLVALHSQTSGSSAAEQFQASAYGSTRALGLAFTSDPATLHLVGGRAQTLHGVQVERELAGNPVDDLGAVANGVQVYFPRTIHLAASQTSSASTGGGHTRGRSSRGRRLRGVQRGLEVVAVAKVAGIAGVIAERSQKDAELDAEQLGTATQVHAADMPDFGGAIEMQSMFFDLKSNEEARLRALVAKRPEITAMLTDFMRAVLVRKPDDVYKFASEFFSDN
ncbi:hypothetical protein BC828DRAFT_405101 [Blastocladiella britannica]|nr:hypothetical protein BC828DRAFT_405101 [Blastocladiella britannica]